jgi:hypothetical protein
LQHSSEDNPDGAVRQAVDAAGELHSILSSSNMTQLLQEAPPASLTADQDKLLRQFYSLL